MEQRRKTRFPLNLKLEMIEPRAPASGYTTVDISSSGVRFQSAEELPVGHRIVYRVILLDREPRVSIRCHGSVVRIRGTKAHFEIAATVERHEAEREFIAARQ